MEEKLMSKNEIKHSSILYDNLSKKDQCDFYVSDMPRTPSALKDLNAITKEKLHAIESAQRKWVEDVRNWTTTDEIQKAQMEWIQKFSSMPSFNTIHSPEKKTPWTLPFSPPRSSYEKSPRRGFCVYEPGRRDTPKKVLENTSDCVNDIKYAQLEEPRKAISKTPEKTLSSSPFSPFPDIKSNKVDKSVRKKHITIRKRLHCLKKLEKDETAKESQNIVTTPKAKSDITPDRTEEDRKAARKYIQRKRVERDRQLREQREQEEKAEQEQKARLERLKETQHRILVNSVKKQPKQRLKKESWVGLTGKEDEEDKPLSREMIEPPEYSGAHITGAIPFLSNREKLNSSEKGSKSTPSTPTLAGLFGWTQDENVPPPNDSPVEDNIVEGTPIPRRSLPESLSALSLSVKDSTLSETKRQSSEASTPSKVNSLPLQKPSTPSLSSTPICSKLSSNDSLFPRSSLDSVRLINRMEPFFQQPSLPDSQPLLIHGDDHPIKLTAPMEDEQLTKTISFAPEFKQKEASTIDKLTKTYDRNDHFTLFTSPANIHYDSQYNLLAAISNKRSAFKDFEHDSNKKQPKILNNFGIDQPTEMSYRVSEGTVVESKKVREKGVQCHVETDEMEVDSSSCDQLGSWSSCSGVKLTQSERLQKPNLILLPGRVSDPGIYNRWNDSIHDVVRIHSTVSDNLSIDPLVSVPAKLSLEPQRSLEVDNINDSQSIQGVCDDITHVELPGLSTESLVGLRKQHQTFDRSASSLEMMDLKRNVELIRDSPKLNVPVAIRASEVDSPLIKKLNLEVSVETAKIKGITGNAEAALKKEVASDVEAGLERGATSDISSRDSSLAKSMSSSLQLDFQGGGLSFMNFAKFSLNMFIDLLKEESLRSKQQESHFRMRENSIIDKTKAEIAFLELEKKKFKVIGNEEGVRNVRKKIRGLIIKLQQNLEDLQLVKKMEKAASRGRKKLLLEKVDLLKEQLKKQMEPEKKIKMDIVRDLSNSSIESKKESIKDYSLSSFEVRSVERRGSAPLNFELYKRDLDIQENFSAWKKTAEEGEKTIKKLQVLVKGSPLAVERDQTKMVERGTSPLRLSSDEERKKGDCSLSDTLDQLSTSSQHEKLEDKDARKMIALKIPLSPRVTLKRRHSSGSDESLLLSQTETQSDASDMETRVLALQQQLKQRKAELESLHREYKKSQRERLIAKEQSLLSQIQAYDVYIEQVKKELEKEKDGTEIKVVKPVIKHPKLSCDRRKSDTWLLQDRQGPRSGSENSYEVKPGLSGKLGKDDKFLDNQSLHKYTLKMDFSAEVGDNQQSAVDGQFKIVPQSDLNEKPEIGKEGQSMNVCMLKVNEKSLPNACKLLNDSSVHSNYIEEDYSSMLIESCRDQNNTSQKNKVDEKIDFYEKLSETSLSSAEVSAEAYVKSFQPKQDSNLKGLKGSFFSKSFEIVDVREDYGETKLNIGSEPSGVEGESRTSDMETRVIEVGKNEDNLKTVRADVKIELIDKQDSEVTNGSMLNERGDEFPIGSDSIGTIAESKKSQVPEAFSSNENSKVKEKTSVISTEIDENLLEVEFKDISSHIDDIVSDKIVELNKGVLENSSEDNIKEVSDLISVVSENRKKSDEITSKTNEGRSSDEEISELLSAVKVEDLSKISILSDKRSVKETENSSEKSDFGKTTEEDIEDADQLMLKTLTKKDSIVEEVVSSIESGEMSSGSSFPLPIVNKIIPDTSDKKENTISDGDDITEDLENDQHVIESEIDSVRSETISQVKQLSNISGEQSIEKSQLEEIKTNISKSVTDNESYMPEVEESMKEAITGGSFSETSPNIKSSAGKDVFEEVEEVIDLDRSISESLVDASTIEEADDSLDEQVKELSAKEKLSEGEDSSSDSFLDDKDVYDLLKNAETRPVAPLIDALQREGDSAIDQVWRGIADATINDATDVVISTFVNKANKGTNYSPQSIPHDGLKLVGDSDDDDWLGEELQKQQAEEAEVLRLQQLRIDKEIEELEEEEARRYYYIRAIPDKPPPPYTPRRPSLVASVVEAAGEIWEGKTSAPPSFMAGCHLREFLWDLAAELVVRILPPSPPSHPVWVEIRKRRPKRNIRTKEELLEEVEKEAKICLGVEERKCRENLIIRWSRKRRDHVDEILVKESQEEEWEWTDYSEEENIIKNRIADAIIQESLSTATAAIAQAFMKKFKES